MKKTYQCHILINRYYELKAERPDTESGQKHLWAVMMLLEIKLYQLCPIARAAFMHV